MYYALQKISELMREIFPHLFLALFNWLYITSIDFTTIAERLGIPVAFAIAIFIYFTRRINKNDEQAERYRRDMLELNSAQLAYLRNLVDRKFDFRCGFSEKNNAE